MSSGFDALYLFLLAAIAGYVLIARVASLMHLPLLAGSNFIHGIVWAGAIGAFGHAEGALQTLLALIAVAAATANVVGAWIVTDRSLSRLREGPEKRSSRAVAGTGRHSGKPRR